MKTTKTPFLKDFSKYYFLLVFILGLTNLNAQIIYTDIDPDFVSKNLGDEFYFDLNNDGVDGFSLISTEYMGLHYLEIQTVQNDVNGMLSVTPWYANPLPLDYGTEIFDLEGNTTGETYEWFGYFTIGDCFGGGGGCFYDWENTTDKYLGLRVLINDKTHYGWARFDVTSPTFWVIKDYAYESTPDTAILAGEMPNLGFNDINTLNKVDIVSSNKKIVLSNLEETSQYLLFSMTGQCVLKGSVSNENATIDASTISSGFYIIELTSAQSGQSIRKKLIL